MNKIFTSLVSLAVGAVIGSVVSWKLLKTKYEAIANEEIESVRKMYKKKLENASNKKSENESEESEPVRNQVHSGKNPSSEREDYEKSKKIIDDNEYLSNNEAKGGSKDMDKPYVISPDEFGDKDDYDLISLTYYADHILADDGDQIIDNVDEVVGAESLGHFGEYEDDSVFVRNDKFKTDYEILLSEFTYDEREPSVMNPLDEE